MIDMVGFGRNSAGGGGGGPVFPQSANLAGSWDLFGGNVNQIDNSGNGNDLIPNNAPGQASGGGPDGVNCADLEASSAQRYGLAHASQVDLSPGSSDFAGCIFYNPEALAGNQFIAGKYENSGNGEWYLWYDMGTDTFKLTVRHASGGVTQDIDPSPSIGSFSFLQWYIDTTAQEIGIAHNNGAFATGVLTVDVVASTAPFTIGERAFTGNDFADGRFAICHIWNGAIPIASEWTQLFNGGNGVRYRP